MANNFPEKEVSFLGVWKAQNVTDNLVRQIATAASKKEGYKTRLVLIPDGVKLYVTSRNGIGGQMDLISLQNVADITLNRYNPLCVMCIKADASNKLEIFACRCNSGADSSRLVHAHMEHKRSISGVGYNTNLKRPEGRNWVLQDKEPAKVIRNGVIIHKRNDSTGECVVSSHSTANGTFTQVNDVAIEAAVSKVPVSPQVSKVYVPQRVEDSFRGKTVYHIAVQTDECEDSIFDADSLTSAASNKLFREELLTLSKELREIKFLLEKSTGISAAEFYERKKDDTLKKVEATENAVPAYADARSYGIQTEGKRSLYVKRQQPQSARNTYRKNRPRSRSNERRQVNQQMISQWSVQRPIQDVYGNHLYASSSRGSVRSTTPPVMYLPDTYSNPSSPR